MQNIFPSSRPLRAEFDCASFRSNIELVEGLAPDSKAMIVVKSNAYGHGLVEMSREAGSRDLAVAVPAECEALIKEGFDNRIWILEGPFSHSCLKLSEDADLVWVVHSDWQIDLIESYCSDIETCLTICLKIDTGMKRLGFDVARLAEIKDRVDSNNSLKLHALMTHFSESDRPANEQVVKQQALFEHAVKSTNFDQVVCTLSNSGGVLFYPSSHADYVRPGIMLYGAMPAPDMNAADYKLKPVMSLKSAVIALREVKKGESVGYGGCWTAPCDSRVAVVAVGYGDGYPRHAKNGTPVSITDQTGRCHIVPLVGRVSMDMITVDVTDVMQIDIGDEVELWGEKVASDKVAQCSGTISYELFCNISQRVPRFYR